MTLEPIIVDLGPIERSVGLTYTAMSRAKSLNQVAFDTSGPEGGMPSYDRMTRYYSYKYFLEVRAEEERLDALAKKTAADFEMQQVMGEMDIDQQAEQDSV